MRFNAAALQPADPPRLQGTLASIVTGVLATLLATGLWGFLATVLGGHSTSVPLHWTVVSGVAIGIVASRLRRRREQGFSLPVVLAGLVLAVVWLIASGGRPISLGPSTPFWSFGGAILSFGLAAQLTVY